MNPVVVKKMEVTRVPPGIPPCTTGWEPQVYVIAHDNDGLKFPIYAQMLYFVSYIQI